MCGNRCCGRIQEDLVADLPRIFVEVPGKICADEFILQRANNDNSHIISNDQFRDFADRYDWILAGNRLIKGAVAGKQLSIPHLAFELTIVSDVAAAAESLLEGLMRPSEEHWSS